MTRASARPPSILIAHRDPAWVDRVKAPLEKLGYEVTVCPEPSWAADLLAENRPFDLAALSSEIDPLTQSRILSAARKRRRPPKLMLLLDHLDPATYLFRRAGPLVTHRLSEDSDAFVRAVMDQVGPPRRRG